MNTADLIKIVVPGECVPKARARMSRTGHVKTPEQTRNYERLVGMHTKHKITRPISEGVALHVGIVITTVPPESWSAKKREAAIKGEIFYITRPDLDNYVKSVLDGMNGIAYKDDNQIVRLFAEKRYGKESQVEIGIKILGVNK